MQLVEQRFELGIGDFVTLAADGLALHLLVGRRLRLDRIERVEQLFKLAVGDVLVFDRGCGGRLGNRLGYSNRFRFGFRGEVLQHVSSKLKHVCGKRGRRCQLGFGHRAGS